MSNKKNSEFYLFIIEFHVNRKNLTPFDKLCFRREKCRNALPAVSPNGILTDQCHSILNVQ